MAITLSCSSCRSAMSLAMSDRAAASAADSAVYSVEGMPFSMSDIVSGGHGSG